MIENNSEIYKIPFSEIYYLEKIKGTHSICVVYKGGYAVFRGELADIAKGLGVAFIHSHRAIIVNTLNIRKIDKHNRLICFDNGYKCDYTRNRLKELSRWIRY